MFTCEKAGIAIRWTPRILGGMIVPLVLVYAAGEGVPVRSLSSAEAALFMCLAAMLIGVVVCYWRVGLGCVLVILGYAGFTIYDGDFNLANPFIVFPAVAALHGIAWILDRKRLPGR